MAKKILITAIVLLLLIASLFIGFYFFMGSSEKIESLTLTLSTELGDETSIIERNNNLKEAKIDTTVTINLYLSQILAETATTSCYLYQGLFFGDEEIKFDHTPSNEEKEYLRKMNEFLEGYDLTQAIIRVKTINGDEGFDCVLRGIDDTKNTMVLISEEGLRYTLTLDQAKKQYFWISGPDSTAEECEIQTNSDFDKNLCLIDLAKRTLNVNLCQVKQELAPYGEIDSTELAYDYRCVVYIGHNTKNPSLCEKLKEEQDIYLKSHCYDELGLLLCDVSLCDKIPEEISDSQAYPSSLKERCIIKANQREGQC